MIMVKQYKVVVINNDDEKLYLKNCEYDENGEIRDVACTPLISKAKLFKDVDTSDIGLYIGMLRGNGYDANAENYFKAIGR